MLDLPLGSHTSGFRQAAHTFLERFAIDSSCHLSFMGFYDRFKDGVHPSEIGRVARRKPYQVLDIYEKIFRHQCFAGLPYDEYRMLLAQHRFMENLPADPVLRFFVHEMLLAGYQPEIIKNRHRSFAMYVQRREVLLNGKRCSIHKLDRSKCTEIRCNRLRDIHLVAIVVSAPEPVRGIVVPCEVLLQKHLVRGGSHVRVHATRRYEGAFEFGIAA